jgi:tetratricopeptide (TPR) repeat protein
MARRRFNWKFAGAVSAVLAVVASIPAGVYLYHRFKPKDPVALLRAGDQFRQAGDLGAAMWAYGQAKRIRPTDPMVHLKIGDLYYAMRDQGAGNVRLAIDEWTRAEELKPDLTPAWQGLLEANFQGELASAQRADKMHGEDQQYALPLQFSVARNAAEHLLYLDPGNLKARSAMPVLTINLWLLNLPIPETAKERSKPAEDQPTDAKKLDQAVAELTGLMRDHPDDADLPFWIARAKIGQAMRLASQSAPEPAPLDGAPRAPSGSGAGCRPGRRRPGHPHRHPADRDPRPAQRGGHRLRRPDRPRAERRGAVLQEVPDPVAADAGRPLAR